MSIARKNFLAASALALAVFIGIVAPAQAQNAAAYIVTDSVTGHALLSLNEKKKLQVGSLTKIATAMVVLDWVDLHKADIGQLAVVPPQVVGIEGQNPVGFQPGDRVSLRDLLYAALLQSDNVAAYTLANHVGQSLPASSPRATPVDRFVMQMNALARQLDMRSTLFVNPHGLDANERKLPYSTAADLAKLTRYAMSKPQFRFYVSQKDRRITMLHAGGEQSEYLLQNTNELLGIDAIDGVKTGTTRRAGQCVIISAARTPESKQVGENQFDITPRRLFVVVLGSDARFQLASVLLRNGWAKYEAWAAAGRPLARGERSLQN